MPPGSACPSPSGRGSKEGIVIALTETCDLDPARVKSVEKPLESYPAVLPALMTLARQMAEEAHCPLAETLRLMLPAQMRGGRIRVATEPVARLLIPPERLEQARSAQGRSQKRRLLLTLLQDGDFHPVAELKLLVREPNDALRALA